MKIFLLLALLLASCATKKEPEKDDSEPLKGPERRIVGRIASVSRAGQFVLIQRLGTGTLPGNMVYQSRGPDGRTASLKLSGERVRDFYAADLRSGTAQKGDAVVAYLDSAKKKDKTEKTETSTDDQPKNEKAATEEVKEEESDQDPETIKDSD